MHERDYGSTKVAELYGGDTQKERTYCYLKTIFQERAKVGSDFETLRRQSCALVSTSGALLAHSNGPDIDEHDAVMRFHSAPTVGYEDHVGRRTDINLVGQPTGLEVSDRRNGRADMTVIQALVQDIFSEFYPTRAGMHNVPPGGLHDPTTGSKGVLVAIANCGWVDAYEMAPSTAASQSPYHYYDTPGGKAGIHADDNDWHGMIKAEHDLWRRISVASADDHDGLGKTSYPGFSTVECPAETSSPGAIKTAYTELHRLLHLSYTP